MPEQIADQVSCPYVQGRQYAQTVTRLGIIGGGILGCLAALEADQAGHDVTLFEASGALMDRASRWNEGKIHLGFTYAMDSSLQTARVMIEGAFTFIPTLERLTGEPFPSSGVSKPFTYFVHADSQLDADNTAEYFSQVDELVHAKYAEKQGTYPGYSGGPTFRKLSRSEVDLIAGEWATVAFETCEISVASSVVARQVVNAIELSSVDVRLRSRILEVSEATDGHALRSITGEIQVFDSVVNAAWEDRLRLDATRGVVPNRAFSHRYKAAIHSYGLRQPTLHSATILVGPYGDIVSFEDQAYLSWYPLGRIGMTSELAPPDYGAELDDARRRQVLEGTLSALAELFPSVRAIAEEVAASPATRVEGGYIFAWGDTDIEHASSELHNRFDIGVSSDDSYHSVDTGKYTTGPLFATRVVSRLGAP